MNFFRTFYPIDPNGSRFYDSYEMKEKHGFTNEDDLFYEMFQARNESRRFDVYQFKRPEIPGNIPERFDFYSFPDVMEHPIIMPDIASIGNSGEVVSFSFIEKMRELGFHDFVTYPVRVHLVNTYDDFYSHPERGGSKFSYRDDLFVMLQLTAPLFPLLEPIVPGELIDVSRREWSDKLYLPKDYETIEYPLFFRLQYAHFELRCNEIAATALSVQKFAGIRVIGRPWKLTE